MNGQWCYFKSYLNKDDCAYIIEKAKLIPTELGKTGYHVSGALTETRRSKVSWFGKEHAELGKYHKILDEVARWGNKDFFGFHLAELPQLQFTEYDSSYQGMYASHQDIFWMKKPFHRKVSIVVNLTDPNDYEGGDLKFKNLDNYPPDVIKTQGTVILFPSFIDHEVTPVTKGIRHSLVGWYEGPHFV